jgi:methylthioribose-1-phosphate isomerase
MRVQGVWYKTVWMDGGVVRMIDQRLLPHRFEIIGCPTLQETARAIRDMTIRGAGAIGGAAGYAMAQGVQEAAEGSFRSGINGAAEIIRATRPTAHDLFFAVEEVRQAALEAPTPTVARQAAMRRAEELAQENAKAGEAMGRAGAALFKPGTRLLTHCNAGWLAFVDWGSALAPVYAAREAGTELFVYATETRPRSQGAKLTAWELSQAGIPHQLIADTAAGSLFQQGRIDAVIVGADRVAANGDTANKIGTYQLAVLAQRHRVPFYVAAPHSTFDLAIADGRLIPIEQRDEDEVLSVTGLAEDGSLQRVRVADPDTHALNPAFDVTPAELVSRFVTESGLVDPSTEAIASFVRSHRKAAVQ